ncbi:Hint domain-containing protein [Limimaricola pyoseonensis]|uniref:Hint domain-containing protein n=1 Tax=Limimaricola pyoseonensis TaxID=521013 RepID=A0A1G7IC07_9RHOB|nr:Hint domain-containing protein [Limimaricola pyoseonensis]SDF10250.1 Hint domain-containing protein [Limimaricola pyoseonensis]
MATPVFPRTSSVAPPGLPQPEDGRAPPPDSVEARLAPRPVGAPPRPRPSLMRRIEILCVCPRHPGDIIERSDTVPALPVFEDAVSAIARGALLPTDRGLVAIEDLWPGDKVKTATQGFRTLLWRGSTTIVAGVRGQAPEMGRLTRISADALGIARPMHDLLLGPAARLVRRGAAIERITGHRAAAIPAHDLLDGLGVVEVTPPSGVQVFHLGFERQQRLVVNGVEMESYHPGPAQLAQLDGETRSLFLACFPHLSRIEDFGPPALPRLRLSDLEMVA